MLADQLEKVRVVLEDWFLSGFITALGLTKIRGKAMHLSRDIHHLRVLVAEISLKLGTESDPDDEDLGIDWDKEMSTTGEMADLSQELWQVMEKGAPEGTELWPLHQSTLYARFLHVGFQESGCLS